jgi:hypothetical protein
MQAGAQNTLCRRRLLSLRGDIRKPTGWCLSSYLKGCTSVAQGLPTFIRGNAVTR